MKGNFRSAVGALLFTATFVGIVALAPASSLRVTLLKQGTFLVASPALNDPNFRQTVVFLVEQNTRGAFGLIINRPAGIKTDQLFPDLKRREALALYVGGPVGKRLLFALLGEDPPPKGARKILNRIYFIGEGEGLLSILKGKDTPGKFRVFTGYSGWRAGQLEKEVLQGDWRIIDADSDSIFVKEASTLWQALSKAGEKIQIRGD